MSIGLRNEIKSGFSLILMVCLSQLVFGDPEQDSKSYKLDAGTLRSDLDFFLNADFQCATDVTEWDDSDSKLARWIELTNDNFETSERQKKKLRKYIDKHPNHSILNSRAAYLMFIKPQSNSFRDFVYHASIAVNAGDPNAAYMLAVVALGGEVGEPWLQNLQPNISGDELKTLTNIVYDCLSLAARSEVWLGTSQRRSVPSWWYGQANQSLASVSVADASFLPYGITTSLSFENLTVDISAAEKFRNKSVRAWQHPQDRAFSRDILIRIENIEKEAKRQAKRQAEIELKNADRVARRKFSESRRITDDERNMITKKCRGYTTIKGICMALSLKEMQSVLLSRGYMPCRLDGRSFCTSDQIGKGFINFGNTIDLSVGRVEFPCRFLNACSFSVKEFSQKVIDAGLVSGRLEGSSTSRSYKNIFTDRYQSETATSYCGRGLKGEKLCIKQSVIDGSVHGSVIQLDKGVAVKFE